MKKPQTAKPQTLSLCLSRLESELLTAAVIAIHEAFGRMLEISVSYENIEVYDELYVNNKFTIPVMFGRILDSMLVF